MSPLSLATLLWTIAERDPIATPLTIAEWRVLRRLSRRCRRFRGHLLFTGSDSDGYKRVWVHGKRWLVHRWIYETFVGAATGMDVDHKCGIRNCGLCLRKMEPWKNRGWREPR